MFELRSGKKILHTGTWEECRTEMNKHAFKNSGMSLLQKRETKSLQNRGKRVDSNHEQDHVERIPGTETTHHPRLKPHNS